mgnify:CR=1 FL=1
MFRPTSFNRTMFFIFIDIIVSLFTLFLAYNLRFNFTVPQEYMHNFIYVFIYLSTLKLLLFTFFNLYKISWRFFSLNDAKKILYAHAIAYAIFVMTYYALPSLFIPFPRTVIIIDIFLSSSIIVFIRMLKRIVLENHTNDTLKRTMIIGASSFAQTLMKEKNSFYITAVIDDSQAMIGTYFSNIKVDDLLDLEKVVTDEKIESVIITKDYSSQIIQSLYDRLNLLNMNDIKIVSINDKKDTLKSLGVEDLLARRPQDLDKEKIASFINNKTILVTGAGGSIGSEICRTCEKFGAKKLILLDNSEYNLYSVEEELKNVATVAVMQNVKDIDLIEETFKLHKPDIVIHAAAYKHVPLVEANIHEAIRNNVLGTKNVIDLAIKHRVEKFVMISTDKAVRPTNVMGTTKRICELYAQNVDAKQTEIVAVRFGNVLGSSGSVIPKFKAQIKKGKNITVTHPDITRYFMLIAEACELVLQAAAIGVGGEIFILDMGEPIKIVDLAQKMIDLSGTSNIKIEFTGLRPGEKLYEELLIDDSEAKTDYESITVASLTLYDIDKLNEDIRELLVCHDKLGKLKEMVPEFNHQTNM